jgi:hypothetical protein
MNTHSHTISPVRDFLPTEIDGFDSLAELGLIRSRSAGRSMAKTNHFD